MWPFKKKVVKVEPVINYRVVEKEFVIKLKAVDVNLLLVDGGLVSFTNYGNIYSSYEAYCLTTGEYKYKPDETIAFAYASIEPVSTEPFWCYTNEVTFIEDEVTHICPINNILKITISPVYESDKTDTRTLNVLEKI